MRSFSLFFVIVLFAACRPAVRINGRTLADTLEILKKKTDFRPLDSVEAYNFLNKYYLPRLDTSPTKRHVFIYQLKGRNFGNIYKNHEREILRLYGGEKKIHTPPISHVPPLLYDTTLKWDGKKLDSTIIIADNVLIKTIKNIYVPTTDNEIRRAWHKRYGFGYTCISYPQYNANTKILIMREWIEDLDWCGTGRESIFHYKKTAGGWEAY